eukprot:TRINITY_DN11191_c0_g1_i1.p1 TRINITY_DN11191_c0_g1~~TRINITY_DN11191_c0_g1_i1.p1  ORF type:complete len:199 (-),score=59.79 TRINITY_DN11191_c0_g1_i1:115-711(-)
MSNSLPTDLQQTISSFETEISSIEKQLRPFFAVPLKDVTSQLTPLDEAKLNVITAFAINNLFYMYLKAQGVSTTTHPVKQELERIKLYFKKIRELATGNEPTSRLDVDAAKRFIQHATGKAKENNKENNTPVSQKSKHQADESKKENLENMVATKSKKEKTTAAPSPSSVSESPKKTTPEKRKRDGAEAKKMKKTKNV